jgi:tRNA G18 (ribose-2'-O)-methylase SpoU
VPFTRVSADRWPGALDELRRHGFTTIALTPAPDAEPLGRLLEAPPARVALLLGAEGPGLSAAAQAATDRRVRIPMEPGVDSVNVATAAAIALAALRGFDEPSR